MGEAPEQGPQPKLVMQFDQALHYSLIIIIIIIIINSIQSRNSRFFTISSLRCELSPTCTLKWPGCNCVHMICNASSANHLQHVILLPCGTKGQLKLYLFELYLIHKLLAEPLTNEGGEETGVPGENPWR